ncbi:hypothetical protein [Ralstonia phage RP31]|uniref:Uncharacterized protein n=2 Tax=Ripduovirus RP12 TaxID=2560700 RepID=A0A1L7N179_9CAUD|nr:hypothetical protein FDH28_gp167 [Ralstonia phage RP12]BAW19228.1 hypothetical protein [Ralstonia phage RP12]BAW19514.1 hypothetical protein [Ralstonia phage RP31]
MTDAEINSVSHVGDWKFGYGVRIEDHTEDISKVPKRFVSTDVQILLRERYEQAYGIYNHQGVNDHFALVRHHWCEDTIVASRLRERMEAYLDARIGQHFHLSWTDFINQPTYVCDLMLEILDKRTPAQNQEIEALMNEIKSSQGKK